MLFVDGIIIWMPEPALLQNDILGVPFMTSYLEFLLLGALVQFGISIGLKVLLPLFMSKLLPAMIELILSFWLVSTLLFVN